MQYLIQLTTSEYLENSEKYALSTVQNSKDSTKPLIVTMTLNDKKVPMEIDTGSAVTILPESTYKAISTDPLQDSIDNKTLYLF